MLLIVSLIVNVTFCINLGLKSLNSPEDRWGGLRGDVRVSFFSNGKNGKELITVVLPKGITVRDASPRGFDHVDLFEPYRFQITFSSDYNDLVDYTVDKNKLRLPLSAAEMLNRPK